MRDSALLRGRVCRIWVGLEEVEKLQEFLKYMFWPDGAPFWTGAVWANQVQWTLVTLPTLALGLWRLDRRHAKRHRELERKLTSED